MLLPRTDWLICRVEIANLEETSQSLTQRWEQEKGKLGDAQKLKEELDARRTELEQAQRRGDLAKAGELAYGVIPQLEKQVVELEAIEGDSGDGRRGCARPITSPIIVSRWTGVPVEKMLEGERGKLLRMEDELGKRVIGQSGSGRRLFRRRCGAHARDCRIPTGRSVRSCSLGRPVLVRPS